MIYLDNSATTWQYDEVTDLIYRLSKEGFGNPSSLHSLGFDAAKRLKADRQSIEKWLPSGGHIIFTSSGTESDNTALISAAHKMKRSGKRIITTAVEHPAVTETCKRLADEGFEIVYLPVDSRGAVSLLDLAEELSNDTILVSVMSVNNEVGTIQPVKEIAKEIRAYNKKNGTDIIFHTDAVQAFGKFDMREVNADLISASAHKFHGPKGEGFLYIRDKLNLPPFITGGGQEGGMRSSTENTTGIAGMALAAEISNTEGSVNGKIKYEGSRIELIKDVSEYLLHGLKSEIKDIRINGPEISGCSIEEAGMRCPSVLNITFEGTRGEVLLHTLEQHGIYVSTGSACSSNHPGVSPVLQAIGLSAKEIEGAVRFSFSEFNTREEMDVVIDKTKAAVERFRRLGSYQ